MASVKVEVKDQDRLTLISLVKAERANARIQTNSPVTTQAQKRAVEFYQDHLYKLHKKLDPNNNNVSRYY